MTLLVSQLVNGLVLGVLFILIAVGLSIIFGMLGLVNFAHGAFFALGAYFALTLRPYTGPVALLFIAPIMVAIVGMLVERTLLRPLYNKDPLLGLLLTFGLALFIEELIRVVWGSIGYPFDAPEFLFGIFHYGPVIVTKYRLTVLGVTAVLLVCVWLFLEKTPYGRIIRAGSRDGEMVSMLGINLHARVHGRLRHRHGAGRRRRRAGGTLVERAAVDGSPRPSCRPSSWSPSAGWAASAAPWRAACMIGVSIALCIQFWPAAASAIMYVLMALVLLLRPRGLFGERWERFE